MNQKMTLEKFQKELIRMEYQRYAKSLVQSTLEHWSDEACKLNSDCHIAMISRLNDEEEIDKMYLLYLNS